MNESVLLDFLLSNSNGTTFYYDYRMCSLSLLKEVILRGFQVCNLFPFRDTYGMGYGNGSGGRRYEYKTGLGVEYVYSFRNGGVSFGNGWGDGDGGFPYVGFSIYSNPYELAEDSVYCVFYENSDPSKNNWETFSMYPSKLKGVFVLK